jgi:hypothetical protein
MKWRPVKAAAKGGGLAIPPIPMVEHGARASLGHAPKSDVNPGEIP